MAPKRKYYVVWVGRTPGIYSSWDDAKTQVHNYPGAKFKSFDTEEQAERAYRESYLQHAPAAPRVAAPAGRSPRSAIRQDAIAVDAACSGNPGPMEYQGVRVSDAERLFHVGPLPEGTNNVGEFLAIVHGMALLQKQGLHHVPIYTDSRNAMLWIAAGKCKTKLAQTPRNAQIFHLIARAENWLTQNPRRNPVLKWETESWGEIPADFGRK
ncbi:MAG: viroplasmin family protein [Saprospiraceae bacterium]